MNFAFFGSSLVSAYWNGACTYYRGIVRNLHDRGHSVTFFEPDALDRQKHRDIDDPEWAEVVVYDAETEGDVLAAVEKARGADVLVKTSGVGVFDELLEAAVLDAADPRSIAIFWDVDAPATLAEIEASQTNSLRSLIPGYDLVFTYGGGDPVVERYRRLGAQQCVPIYNALDPATHRRVKPRREFVCDLAFLGNRLPDREARVEEFFFRATELLPDRTFILGGAGWADHHIPANVKYLGHISPQDHNVLNSSPLAVLNVSRESMAVNGWSPATRVFEAAGAGACLITDAWQGIELFLEPDEEVLVARDGAEVAEAVRSLTPERARAVGGAAMRRATAEHTYAVRAQQVEEILEAAR